MTRQIDIALFTQTTGDLDILAAVGKVFLVQLVPWRLALQEHTARFDVLELTNLVHRMKGSCHVVAAMAAATAFEQAENGLKQMNAESWRPNCHRLLALTEEIEADLQAVMVTQAQR